MSDITGRSLPFKMKMHLRQALLPRFAALNRRRKRNSHFIQLQIKNRMLNRLELRLKAMKYDHEAQITGLLHSLKRREEVDAGSVWYWQEEGDNAVETLACQVVMEAGVVRKFVKAVDELAAERERAKNLGREPASFEQAWRQAEAELTALRAVLAVVREHDKNWDRYQWLANRVLACDYGDNNLAGEQIGWCVRHDLLPPGSVGRQPAFMYGPSIDAAIDAAREGK